ncbi:hypothetical protein HRbin14_01497 [bacterium HR14]|nr:hypothetical protein HRbin14_01497 [bacterium HR14]
MRFVFLNIHDFATGAFQVNTEFMQDAGCQPFALANQTKQQVFRPDVVVVQLPCFVVSEVNDALGARGERHLLRRACLAPGRIALNLVADALQAHPQTVQNPRSNAIGLTHKPQKEMLGADLRLPQPLRFLLRIEDHLARTLSKPLPHHARPSSTAFLPY